MMMIQIAMMMHLDNECQNGPVKVSIFRDSPELEMPGVNQRPEDEG